MVLQDGAHRYELGGRVAAMVRFLAERATRLNGQERVRLEFNCAGDVIKPRVEFHEDVKEIKVI